MQKKKNFCIILFSVLYIFHELVLINIFSVCLVSWAKNILIMNINTMIQSMTNENKKMMNRKNRRQNSIL